MLDALRKGLMDLGVEKMFSALECASGTHSLVTGVVETEMDADDNNAGATEAASAAVGETGERSGTEKCQDVSEDVLNDLITDMTQTGGGKKWGYMLKNRGAGAGR